MMTRLLMLIPVVTTIAMAAPAYADPDPATPAPTPATSAPAPDTSGDDAHFLSDLKANGITFKDPAAAIATAKQVCTLADKGTSQADIVKALQSGNPGFVGQGATEFTALAAASYCPKDLGPAPKPSS